MAASDSEARLERDNRDLREQLAAVNGGCTPLALAQLAFEKWIRIIDSMCEDAELNFAEFRGAARNQDMTAAGEALGRAEGKINIIRQEILSGLARKL